MKIKVEEIFSPEKCDNFPKNLYVFGENLAQRGQNFPGGGQAVIRGKNNAFGFSTLTSIGDFWSDKRFNWNRVSIERDIQELKEKAKDFDFVVFPKYGLGTGRARMQNTCPKTFLYLSNRLLEEFEFSNIEFLEVKNF